MCDTICQPTQFQNNKEPSLKRLPVIHLNKLGDQLLPTNACQNYYNCKDPRLFDVMRCQKLYLDRKPYEYNPEPFEVLYSDKNNEFGRNYGSYARVNAGDIVYYDDKELSQAFYNPVYSTTSRSVGIDWSDPMSNMKPQYYRIPVVRNDQYVATEGLSSIRDINEFRENLIASQQLKNNQQSYDDRFG